MLINFLSGKPQTNHFSSMFSFTKASRLKSFLGDDQIIKHEQQTEHDNYQSGHSSDFLSFTGLPPSPCKIHTNTTYLYINDCKSVEKVELTSCEGSCGASSSMWDSWKYAETNYLLIHAKLHVLFFMIISY